MKIATWVVIVFLSIFYVAVPLVVLFCVKDDKKFRRVMWILLSLFFAVLFVGVLGKIDINQTWMNIGFDFSGELCQKTINWTFKTTKLDRVINLLMLMPIGEAVCIFSKRKNIKWGFVIAVLCGALIGGLIETLQFVLPVSRSVQISDVVFNMISSAIGYLFVSVVYYLAMGIKCLIHNKKA